MAMPLLNAPTDLLISINGRTPRAQLSSILVDGIFPTIHFGGFPMAMETLEYLEDLFTSSSHRGDADMSTIRTRLSERKLCNSSNLVRRLEPRSGSLHQIIQWDINRSIPVNQLSIINYQSQ